MTRKPKPLEAPRRAARPVGLSAEDRELWDRLAKTLDQPPPQKSRGRIAVKPAESSEPGARPRAEPLADPGDRRLAGPERASRGAARSATSETPPSPPPPGPPPLGTFDRKRARGLVTGRVAIDAKLDLHGLRQDEAYQRLCGFLRDCSARGLSTVIVVTGKGGVRPASQPTEFGYGMPERGVLRRNVPLWLEQAELRVLVASFRTAGIKHGGDGAFYIHLRKRRDL